MNTTRAEHPIPLFLTALVAFFSALAALAVSTGHDADAHGEEPHHANSPAAVALHNDMRSKRPATGVH